VKRSTRLAAALAAATVAGLLSAGLGVSFGQKQIRVPADLAALPAAPAPPAPLPPAGGDQVVAVLAAMALAVVRGG